MKIGFASGKLTGTKQHKKEQSQDLQIMDGANCIKKGNPVYTTTRGSIWSMLVTKIAKAA